MPNAYSVSHVVSSGNLKALLKMKKVVIENVLQALLDRARSSYIKGLNLVGHIWLKRTPVLTSLGWEQ